MFQNILPREHVFETADNDAGNISAKLTVVVVACQTY